MTNKIAVLTTCGSQEEAERLAHSLLEQRLAACVSIVPRIQSVYRWQGKIENATEYLLIIKTERERFEAIRTALETGHSYALPEVLALPVVEGSTAYLAWIEKELSA